MSAIGDALDAMVDVIEGVSGITTVYRRPVYPLPTADKLPAVILRVKPATATMTSLTTRQITWPVDIEILVGSRGEDLSADIEDVEPFPELIVAALDAAGNMNNLLKRTIDYAEPSISALPDEAFGVFGDEGNEWAGTRIHAQLHITRVGGFS